MSLLDDVSIVVTPNGYKARTLFGAIPVPTLGADLVTNGDFATDSDWSKGGNWSIGDGVATSNADGNSNISQNIPLTVGTAYSVTYTVVNASAGSRIGISTNATSIRIERTTDGTYTEIFTASLTSFYVRALWNDGNPVSLDNVSVKEWTGADMDVTRATAATRVDEDGLVNYAEVLGDEEITNRDFATNLDSWSTSSWWVWNALGAYHPSTSSHKPLYQQCCVIGKTYLITFELNCVGASLAKFSLGSSTGSTTQVIGTSLPSGSYSYFVTAAAEYIIFNRQNTAEYYVNNVSVKEVTRDNVPRIDYTGGGCPHILAEPQRTNVSTYSEDFSQSFYIKDSGVSVGTTNNISPSGDANATKIDVTDNGRIYANVASDTYASSWYIKAGTFSYFKSGGNIDLVAGTYTGGTIEAVGNGWFRITKQYTGNRPFQIQAYPDGTYSSHTTSGDYYLWGSQLEVGSYTTSYIPTSGGTVTRNQDIFTRDGIGSLINSTEGTLVIEPRYFINDGDATGRKISISDGTGTNRIYITPYQGLASRIRYIFTNGGATQADLQVTGIDITVSRKLAFVWATNRFELWQNGSKISEDTSGTTPSAGTFNQIHFGSETGNGTELFEGELKQLQVYTTALSDEQLLQLTGESGTDFYESYAEMASALTYTIQ